MSDEIIIRCCAPTLAAIKTGSLFNCPVACAEEVTEGLRQVNLCLLCKGVCAIPLHIRGGRALVYLYRPAMLERDLSDPLAVKILREAGYPVGNVNRQILTKVWTTDFARCAKAPYSPPFSGKIRRCMDPNVSDPFAPVDPVLCI